MSQPLQSVVAQQTQTQLRRNILHIEREVARVHARPHMPLELFKRHFLNFFAGRSPEGSALQQAQWHSQMLADWQLVAGSPFVEVELRDAQGQVAVVVPPLQDREVLGQVGGRSGDLGAAFTYAKARGQIAKAQELHVIDQTAAQVVEQIEQRQPSAAFLQAWEAFYRHFNLKPAAARAPVAAAAAEDDGDFVL